MLSSRKQRWQSLNIKKPLPTHQVNITDVTEDERATYNARLLQKVWRLITQISQALGSKFLLHADQGE